jgi:hypothetical protein
VTWRVSIVMARHGHRASSRNDECRTIFRKSHTTPAEVVWGRCSGLVLAPRDAGDLLDQILTKLGGPAHNSCPADKMLCDDFTVEATVAESLQPQAIERLAPLDMVSPIPPRAG